MSSSRSSENITKISNALSFAVDDIHGDHENKNIVFSYIAQKDEYAKLMLVMFTSPDGKIVEKEFLPRTLDAESTVWICEVNRPVDAKDKFFLISDVSPSDSDEIKHAAKPLPLSQGSLESPDIYGIISLTAGKQQPWVNENIIVSKGTLEKLLLKQDGSLSDGVEKEHLKEGEKLITIYLPPGYSESRNPPYDFQIVLDGDQFLNSMRMDAVLDNLAAENKIYPSVTLFVSPYAGPPDEKLPGFFPVTPPGYSINERIEKLGCNLQTDEELSSLPGIIRKRFNITDDPQKTTLRGFSFGGLQSIYTAIHHPDIFGNVVAQSPSAWWGPPDPGKKIDLADNDTWKAPKEKKEKQEYLRQIIESGRDERAKKNIANDRPINFYLQAGTKETAEHSNGEYPLKESTERLARVLMNKGHSIVGRKVHLHNGGHDEIHARCGIAEGEIAMQQHLSPLRDDITASYRSSSAFLIARHNFGSNIPAPVPTIYPLGKQNNLTTSNETPLQRSDGLQKEKSDRTNSSDVSAATEEMKDNQNSESTATSPSPFKNLSGTQRFTRK